MEFGDSENVFKITIDETLAYFMVILFYFTGFYNL